MSCSCHTICCPRWLNYIEPLLSAGSCFFSPRSQSSRTKLSEMQPNSELDQNTVLNLILNSVYVLYFNLNFVFPCFLFLPFSFYFPFEFWSKSKLFLNPILHFIYSYISLLFELSVLLPSFPNFPSFFLFFRLSFLFHVPFSFPFLIIKVFQFSDNLSNNLAITCDNLLLKKEPRKRDRLIWS